MAEYRSQIQHTWDKHRHGRNAQKQLQLDDPPPCQLCQLTPDSQVHVALRCSHPYLNIAREGSTKEAYKLIDMAPQGAGKALLINRWKWVLHPYH